MRPRSTGGASESRECAVNGLDVFPYGIVYFVRDDEVLVVAYAHERRRPGYWRERLADL